MGDDSSVPRDPSPGGPSPGLLARMYGRALHGSRDAITITRLSDEVFVDANESFFRLVGFGREEVLGRTSLEIGLWLDPQDRARLVAAVTERRSVEGLEVRVRTKSGEERVLRTSADVIDLEGESYSLAISRDITEELRSEEQLGAFSARMSMLLESLPVAFVALDADSRVTFVNAVAEQIMRKSRQELLGEVVWDVLPEARGTALEAAAIEVLRDRKRVEIEEFYEPYGIWVEVQAYPVQDGGIVSYFRDVTDRRLAAEREREAQARYAEVFDNAVEGIFRTAADGRLILVNPALARTAGFSSPEEMIASVPDIGAMYSDPARREELLQQLSLHGLVRDFEIEGSSSDGSPRWASMNARAVLDESGAIIGVDGTIVDITERKLAEEAARAAETRYLDMFENSPAGIFRISGGGEILVANPSFARMAGFASPEELLSSSVNMRMLWDDPARRDGFLKELAAKGHVHDVEMHMRRLDGQNVWVSVTATALKDENGALIGLEGSGIDITERKLAEQERRTLLARMVEALEEERSRIANDIHDDSVQMMTAVSLRLAALRRGLTNPEQIESLSKSEASVTRAIDRLRHLMFELRPRALDVEGLAAALRLHLEQDAAEYGFEFHLDDNLEEEPPVQMRTIAFRIAQEALVNARKHAGAKKIDVSLQQASGGLLIRVSDDGVGFDQGHVPEAGIPGHLGLDAMRERARLAGGTWKVSSLPGEGTTVEFWLPLEG